MKPSLSSTLLTLLATQTLASYLGSCSNCRLEKWSNDWLSGDDEAPVLLCDCRRTDGSTRGSRLDLNNCIANVDGNLAAREGEVQLQVIWVAEEMADFGHVCT